MSAAAIPVTINGYAGTPGSGPRNQTCGSCCYSIKHQTNAAHPWDRKRWYKCGHELAPEWTTTPATDVAFASPACQHWKASRLVKS